MQQKESTENKIINAAAKIFLDKGWSGARMQDIADEAEINKAMLHYYYRNKEVLFINVFKEKARKIMDIFLKSIPDEVTLEEMIYGFIDNYINLLQENPNLPRFILNEVSRHPQLLDEVFEPTISPVIGKFKTLIDRETKSGKIREISFGHFIINMVSMSVFPILAKPIFSRFLLPDKLDYSSFIDQRKKIITDCLLNDLKAVK